MTDKLGLTNPSVTSAERVMLRILFGVEGDGWKNAYDFHFEYLFSPAQVVHFVAWGEKLKLLEMREVEGHTDALVVRLTAHGRYWLIANRRAIFLSVDKDLWKTPAGSCFRRPTIGEREYFPKMNKIGFLN